MYVGKWGIGSVSWLWFKQGSHEPSLDQAYCFHEMHTSTRQPKPTNPTNSCGNWTAGPVSDAGRLAEPAGLVQPSDYAIHPWGKNPKHGGSWRLLKIVLRVTSNIWNQGCGIKESPPLCGGLVFGKPFLVYHRSGVVWNRGRPFSIEGFRRLRGAAT